METHRFEFIYAFDKFIHELFHGLWLVFDVLFLVNFVMLTKLYCVFYLFFTIFPTVLFFYGSRNKTKYKLLNNTAHLLFRTLPLVFPGKNID
jgi:hypothetical protein